MLHTMSKYCYLKKLVLLLTVFVFPSLQILGQNSTVIRGRVTSGDKEPLIMATVTELDKTNRIVNGVATNLDGAFVMQIKNKENKLVVTYTGFLKQTLTIGNKTMFQIVLEEDLTLLKAVEVTAKKMTNTGAMMVPTREISTAMQRIEASEFEGLQVGSVDEALQGRVAGLDIMSNSGEPGSGMSMRIRGTTSLTGSSMPLIVVNGVPFETTVSGDFDFSTAKEEQYADLLNVNPDDILDIVVLKDAASTAIWGSKGASGVLQITTKRGKVGKPKIEVSYRLTTANQPKPIPMLNGDNYTMYMKEAYLNPALDNNPGNIPELNYDPSYTEYWNYNNNTDWVSQLKQQAWKNDFYSSLSGGDERGSYRITLGYLDETGTVIGQSLKRFSNRTDLTYNLSDRLVFNADLSYTYTDNDKNYTDLLAIAYKKMPNISVFKRDQNGDFTDVYYNVDRSTSKLNSAQRDLANPLAIANLAKQNEKNYRILPRFSLKYDILDPQKQVLQFKSSVSIDVTNNRKNSFYPKEVSGAAYDASNVNAASNNDDQGMNFNMDNNIFWKPNMPDNHSLQFYASMQTGISSGSAQGYSSYWAPSTSIQDVASNIFIGGDTKSSSGEGHSFGALATSHYAFKNRYIFDVVIRRDASSRFGKKNRVGYFPGFSAKWIISDEPFMKKVKMISMLAIRPSWGVSGKSPGKEGLHYSKYGLYSDPYIDMPGFYPLSLQIDNLRWEKATQMNLGMDINLFQDRLIMDLNAYHKRSTDLLLPNKSIPTSSGFMVIDYVNVGVMDNDGWELNFNGPKVFKIGKASIDLNLNLSNNYNIIRELSPDVQLSKGNMYSNGEYLTNTIIGKPSGAFYGYKYKGVYQYNDYVKGEQECAPIARDEFGEPILDKKGNPKPMYFYYYESSHSYIFKGGDAMYEDINHDGSIDANDVVYLGSVNPLLNGGFGMTFRYGGLSLNAFFNFRYGNKIVNDARMNSENMYGNDNQSIAVNWRWRKDGDVTMMPRALYQTGYNWLGSDRYVEDGSFLRWKYLTMNYSLPKEYLKPIGLQSLKFYLSLTNVLILTNYSGVDPEVLGHDGAKTPRPKEVTFSVMAGF